MSGLIFYTSEDVDSHFPLGGDRRTVWLTQADMAEPFGDATDNLGLHLKNVVADRELKPERTSGESSAVQRESGGPAERVA